MDGRLHFSSDLIVFPNIKSRSLPKPKPKPKKQHRERENHFSSRRWMHPFGDPPEVIEGLNFWRILLLSVLHVFLCVLWVCKDVFLKQKLTLVVCYNSNCECGREILVRTKILFCHLKGIQREVLVPASWEADLWVRWDEPEKGTLKLCLQTSITYNDKRVHAGALTALNGGKSWETSAGTRAVLRKFGKVSWRERWAASGSGNRGWGNAHPGCLSRGLLVASWVRCPLGRPALCVPPSPISPPLSPPPCHPRAPSSTSTPPSSPSIISW